LANRDLNDPIDVVAEKISEGDLKEENEYCMRVPERAVGSYVYTSLSYNPRVFFSA
jgi:hypothetical protein